MEGAQAGAAGAGDVVLHVVKEDEAGGRGVDRGGKPGKGGLMGLALAEVARGEDAAEMREEPR